MLELAAVRPLLGNARRRKSATSLSVERRRDSPEDLIAKICQIAGTEAPKPCERCSRGFGMWDRCVVSPSILSRDPLGGCCANCSLYVIPRPSMLHKTSLPFVLSMLFRQTSLPHAVTPLSLSTKLVWESGLDVLFLPSPSQQAAVSLLSQVFQVLTSDSVERRAITAPGPASSQRRLSSTTT